MTNPRTKGTQKKVKFKTIYMPHDFERIWETFVSMLECKGGASRMIRGWVTEYVRTHTNDSREDRDDIVVVDNSTNTTESTDETDESASEN